VVVPTAMTTRCLLPTVVATSSLRLFLHHAPRMWSNRPLTTSIFLLYQPVLPFPPPATYQRTTLPGLRPFDVGSRRRLFHFQ
jgi:hypothetical protein